MDKRGILLAIGCCGMLFNGAVAIGEEVPMTFEALDVDGNGYISADEAQARNDLVQQWDTADGDKDGKLNSAEFSAFEGMGRFSPPEESEIPEPGAAPYK